MTTKRVSVKLRTEHESFEALFNRFRRGVEKAEVLTDYYRHDEYEKPSQKRKRKRAAAVKRDQRRVQESNANRRMV